MESLKNNPDFPINETKPSKTNEAKDEKTEMVGSNTLKGLPEQTKIPDLQKINFSNKTDPNSNLTSKIATLTQKSLGKRESNYFNKGLKLGSEEEISSSSEERFNSPGEENAKISIMHLKEKILSNKDKYGVTNEELNSIENFLKSNPKELLSREAIHIRKDNFNKLPRSLLFIPEGPREGLYVLLKSKGGVKEVGLGGFNRATTAFSAENGELSIFRTGKIDPKRSKTEMEINQKLALYKEFFVAGIPVAYKGSITDRKRGKNIEKSKRPERELDVGKLGFLMDKINGGELSDLLEENKILDPQEANRIASHMASGLEKMHELGIVHLDLKSENIFLTEEQKPLIADFGISQKIGEKKAVGGTPGYIPPEIISSVLNNELFLIDSKADIWSFGCLLARMTHGLKWYSWVRKNYKEEDEKTLIDQLVTVEFLVQKAKENIFENYRDPNHLDSLIYECLTVDPENRPTAKQIVEKLAKIKSGNNSTEVKTSFSFEDLQFKKKNFIFEVAQSLQTLEPSVPQEAINWVVSEMEKMGEEKFEKTGNPKIVGQKILTRKYKNRKSEWKIHKTDI